MPLNQNKYTQTNYAEMQQRLLPPGEAFPRRNNTFVYSLLLGLGGEHVRIDTAIRELVANAFPDFMLSHLDEWEADLGLPDTVQAIPASNSDRRELIRQRWITIRGFLVAFGANRQFFFNLARMLKQISFVGTITASTTTTATLSAGASAVNDFYNDMLMVTKNSAGQEIQIVVKDYVGATKVVTFDRTLLVADVPFVTAVVDIPLLRITDKNISTPSTAFCGLAECGLDEVGGIEDLITFKVEAVTNGASLDTIIQGMFNLFKPLTTILDISFTL